ncbi:putative acyltransfersase [Conidiobolus coronatus NRRL 28638]|uniref:N-terminal methionine N(alpha)-acetyltransferase NatC n=1 Tax=Conidiobolus coronatus (strain ATCC 28846 / CBS 209.66 / NRRL 28638) TaxID=796925 RepID=A0A137PI95_CONC2|nr:putative acyltransfersase [Conidiobolus coronatus NRRL 28638]|eukprot:KXN74724.1 putative acyltransfersase [Conidiobolus coronatus NRRL 28638]
MSTDNLPTLTPPNLNTTVDISGAPLNFELVHYKDESQLNEIIRLIHKDLSEPYSIYTYRYFLHNWPNLCFLAKIGEEFVGVIVCKLDRHKLKLRGYIAMLAVDKTYRNLSIGSSLVRRSISAMMELGADEIVLETELTNVGALNLYEKLGFIRDKRLHRYYLNGMDAFRLKL